MHRKGTLFFVLICLHCIAIPPIPDELKTSYALQFQTVFALQSEGMSTSAMTYFEDAYTKALQAGEPVRKLEALRKFFVWYRTYGHYLGLMRKDPKISGQYIGYGQYGQCMRSQHFFNTLYQSQEIISHLSNVKAADKSIIANGLVLS